ncbi:MAG: uroporphyrinogen-III C-methyltransferase [Wenzhouxiangellaceae bacterium]|nr:uroporphyrinogen-III C-methyltransferase [Wenzhouxiangellaceae bacterium]
MTEQSSQADETQASSDAAVPSDETEAGAEQEHPGQPETPPAPKRRRNLVAWLALLIALAAAGLAAYVYWLDSVEPTGMPQWQNLQQELAALERQQSQFIEQQAGAGEALERELSSLTGQIESSLQAASADDRRLDQLGDRLQSLADRIERLEQDQDSVSADLRGSIEVLETSLQQRLDQQQRRLERVDSNLDDADRRLYRRLRLIEVDSLLAIGQDRLELLGDVESARAAWRRARQLLEGLDSDRLDALKSALASEYQQLQNYAPDTTGERVAELFGLSDQVSDWPPRGADQDAEGQPAAAPAQASEADGWRQRIGAALQGLVRIDKLDGAVPTADEVERARQRVRSLLQTAALTLARAEPKVAEKLVQNALDDIEKWFDIDAGPVARGLEQLRSMNLSGERPLPPSLERARAELSRLLDEGAIS